jgi:succinyl-diaminopimelate desuccinylase
MNDSLQKLLADLVAFKSITPDDAGCQAYIMNWLESKGFSCRSFDCPPVSNFFACIGEGPPFLMFAGHTDVVPAGPLSDWRTDPFVLHEEQGVVYGRGVADMKGGLASMLMAAAQFLHDYPSFSGRLGFLITSGEEGDCYDKGTAHVMSHLQDMGMIPDYCIIGEPSSSAFTGDVIKIGRRGSLTANVHVHGKQGHVAYPHLAENPIHTVSPVLWELSSHEWDKGNANFPPTSLQFTHLQSGGQASNIIPGDLTLQFNIRFSTEQTVAALKHTVETCFSKHGVVADFEWSLSGEPFLTASGALLTCCMEVIHAKNGQSPECSTSGGTSDGRFIAPYGVEVVELGPVNATIHQVNESVTWEDLTVLREMYYDVCVRLFK